MAEDQPKLYIKVSPEFYEKFVSWADRLGLTRSQFGNMCLQAGIGSLIRAISPEEAFTPEQLIKIIQAGEKQGVKVDFSDFTKPEDGQ